MDKIVHLLNAYVPSPMVRKMAENISVKCDCGHTNRIRISLKSHSKNNDPRFTSCELCGVSFEEE